MDTAQHTPARGDQPTPWLTAAQAAARLQVHPVTLRKLVRQGRLRSARVGRCMRIRPEWADAYLETTVPREVTR